ncbi:MAG: LamG domain-containing protein, partial [Polyangiaceae bacterium]
LDSAANLEDTVSQLVSERPPISMAGVAYDSGAAGATVACTPIDHESVAVTYAELNRYHGGCKDDSSSCDTAAHRFCQDLGWTTGLVFERTSRPWVNCFDADKILSVAKSSLAADCQQGKWTSLACQKSMNQKCQSQGYDAGVRQELVSGTNAEIHCFDAASLQTWKYTP